VTLAAWLKKYNAAPFSLEELAELTDRIDDDNQLRIAAEAFIRAKAAFEAELDRIDYERG